MKIGPFSASLRQLMFWGVVLSLSLTSTYLISVVLVVALAAKWRPQKGVFLESYLSRFVVQLFLFSAIGMVVAMYCWLLGVGVHPLFVIVPYVGLLFLLHKYVPQAKEAGPWVALGDVVALGIAAVGIGVLVVSFYLPQSHLSASVQLIANGFDHGAHLSMIQNTFEEKGYLYGSYDHIKDQIAWKTLTAYPQGWHFANSFLWRGTGVELFGIASRSGALVFYAVTALVWQFLVVFLFAKVAWLLGRMVGLGLSLKNWGLVGAFALACLLVQMVVFWGSLTFGFVTFIGVLCYLLLLVAFLLESQQQEGKLAALYFAFAVIAVSAVGLVWLLPVFASGLAVLLAGLPWFTKKELQKQLGRKKEVVLAALFALLMLAPVMSMAVINHLYTTQESQINDHGGIFGVSSLLVGVIVLASAILFLKEKAALQRVFAAVLVPQLLLLGVVYLYQYITLGHTEYFFTKNMALLLVLVGGFFAVAFTKYLAGLKLAVWPNLFVVLIAAGALVNLCIFTGQDLVASKGLLQRYAQVQPATAEVFADTAKSGRVMERNVIFFTKVDYGGDVNGNVLSTALHKPATKCIGGAIWTITNHEGKKFPKKLQGCLKKTTHKVLVITSKETQPLFAKVQHPNLETVVAY